MRQIIFTLFCIFHLNLFSQGDTDFLKFRHFDELPPTIVTIKPSFELCSYQTEKRADTIRVILKRYNYDSLYWENDSIIEYIWNNNGFYSYTDKKRGLIYCGKLKYIKEIKSYVRHDFWECYTLTSRCVSYGYYKDGIKHGEWFSFILDQNEEIIKNIYLVFHNGLLINESIYNEDYYAKGIIGFKLRRYMP